MKVGNWKGRLANNRHNSASTDQPAKSYVAFRGKGYIKSDLERLLVSFSAFGELSYLAKSYRTQTQFQHEIKSNQGGFEGPPSGSARSTQLSKQPYMPTFNPTCKFNNKNHENKTEACTISIRFRLVTLMPSGYIDFSLFGTILIFIYFIPQK